MKIKVCQDVRDKLLSLAGDFTELEFALEDWFGSNQELEYLRSYLERFLDCEEFSHCDSMRSVFCVLKKVGRYDVFNISLLRHMAARFKSDHVHKLLDEYEQRFDEFCSSTTLKEFEQAVAGSQQATRTHHGTITLILAGRWSDRTLKDLKGLVHDIFGVSADTLVDIRMRPGSIVVQWNAPLSVLPELKTMASKATKLLVESDVQELFLGDECIFKVSTL